MEAVWRLAHHEADFPGIWLTFEIDTGTALKQLIPWLVAFVAYLLAAGMLYLYTSLLRTIFAAPENHWADVQTLFWTTVGLVFTIGLAIEPSLYIRTAAQMYSTTRQTSVIHGIISDKKPPSLPVEVWDMIIDYVLDVPFVLDLDCDPIHFDTFLSYLDTHKAYKRIEAYGARKTLMLVCRSWAIGVRRMPLLQAARFQTDDPIAIPKGIHRLDLSHPRPKSNEPWFQTTQDGSIIPGSHNLRILIVAEASIASDDYLPDELTLIPLRTLAIGRLYHLSGRFTSVLKKLSDLRTLVIRTKTVCETLELPRLEILSLTTNYEYAYSFTTPQPLDISKWSLSSLRQLHLNSFGSSPIEYHPTTSLPCDSRQLVSLIVGWGCAVQVNRDFWEEHPSLIFLKVTRFGRLEPPRSHPLEHLVITKELSALELKHLIEDFKSFPRLRILSLNNTRPSFRLVAVCRSRSISLRCGLPMDFGAFQLVVAWLHTGALGKLIFGSPILLFSHAIAWQLDPRVNASMALSFALHWVLFGLFKIFPYVVIVAQ